MGLASIADATVRVGHGHINVGAGFDTGFMLNKNGLEAKWAGMGGAIGPHGVQVCFIICFGFSW